MIIIQLKLRIVIWLYIEFDSFYQQNQPYRSFLSFGKTSLTILQTVSHTFLWNLIFCSFHFWGVSLKMQIPQRERSTMSQTLTRVKKKKRKRKIEIEWDSFFLNQALFIDQGKNWRLSKHIFHLHNFESCHL